MAHEHDQQDYESVDDTEEELPAYRTAEPYKRKEVLDRHYWENGRTEAEIALRFEVTAPSIHYWLNQHNIPTRPAAHESIEDVENRGEILEYLWEKEWGLAKIAETLGASETDVHRWLDEDGILLEATFSTNKRAMKARKWRRRFAEG